MRAVARNWAEGRGGTDQVDDGDPLSAAAAPILAERARRQAETLPEIAPQEKDAVMLFLHLSTQWRRDGMSGARTGLDYGVVPAVAGMLGITADAGMLADLRGMEHAALARWAVRS